MEADDAVDNVAEVVQTPAEKRKENFKMAPDQTPVVNQQQSMNEDDDILQQHLRNAEQNLDSDPALRDQ